MKTNSWQVLDIWPMLLYLVGCIAWTGYCLYSLISIYHQQALSSLEVAGQF